MPARGMFAYPSLVEPVLPQGTAVTAANLANWYDPKPLQIIPQRTAYPGIEQQFTIAQPTAGNDVTNPYQEQPLVYAKRVAYYYEVQARPILSQGFTPTTPTNVGAIQPQLLVPVKPKDVSAAVIRALASLTGLAGTQPIGQYFFADSGLKPNVYPHQIAQRALEDGQVGNIFPLTVAPFQSSLASWYAEQWQQWQRPHQRAQQGINAASSQPVLPQPFVPAGISVAAWFVDRLPWNSRIAPAPIGALLGRLIGSTILAGTPTPVSQYGWVTETNYFNRYPSQAALRGVLMGIAYPLSESLGQPFAFVIPAQDARPQLRPADVRAAILSAIGFTANIFPLPTSITTVVPGSLLQDPPTQRFISAPNFSALIMSVVGGRIQGLGGTQQVFQFAWQDYTLWPNRYPSQVPAQRPVIGQIAPVFPVTIGPFVSSLPSYFQEWAPQRQPVTRLPGIIRELAFARPTLPQPFVPAPPPSIAGYQQDVFPQILNPQRFNWVGFLDGQVSNYFPLPGPFPPPSPCTAIPSGPDADTSMSSFVDKSGRPIAVLFCRVCKSGLPLLVRGDFAIWCQTCCAFVSREDTFMLTTKSPRFFRSVF